MPQDDQAPRPGGGLEKPLTLIERAACRLEWGVDRAPERVRSAATLNAPTRTPAGTVTDPSTAITPPDRGEPLRPAGLAPGTLIEIDLERLHDKRIVSRQRSRSITAEEIRPIKRNILSRARAGGGIGLGDNLVIVTSARAGDGKTFLSINLAMSIALERDYRVLLIDGDVIRSSLYRELGIGVTRGLIDLLLDPSLSVSDVLLRTNIERLTILPAGEPHDLSSELVASKRMERVLRELADRYSDRIILFDSPPILLSNESLALAQYMGQALMVVAAEETPRASVEAALGRLPEDLPVSIVMNRVRRSFLRRVTNPYYGYGSYGRD
jgi:receptor protein-tyrosine kinase